MSLKISTNTPGLPFSLITDDLWHNLSSAIVLQAVNDWMRLCHSRQPDAHTATNITFTELRNFFKSGYCLALCGNINPEDILTELERRRTKLCH
jgi:hypothetical protein